MAFQISILPPHKIDVKKWDDCVAKSENGLVYASTNYLNFMTKNWSGLVVNDYNAIMPLPWKKKFGIRYLYTPPFTQQLGIIGTSHINTTQLQQALHQFVKYGTYNFNFGNSNIVNVLEIEQHNNFTIDLKVDYHTINAGYKKSFKANLNKSLKYNFKYVQSDDFIEAIQLFKAYNNEKINHVSNNDFNQFKMLCKALFSENKLIIRRVINAESKLLCLVLLINDNKRLYNMINYTTKAGRDSEANYFLYDNVLREFAETPIHFDFEGSDLPGVKHFYESFGAVNQPYFQWHFNKLPWPLNRLKR